MRTLTSESLELIMSLDVDGDGKIGLDEWRQGWSALKATELATAAGREKL